MINHVWTENQQSVVFAKSNIYKMRFELHGVGIKTLSANSRIRFAERMQQTKTVQHK